MSRNGSGTYSLPSGNPVVTGTTISSTWANNTLSDIANGLTQSISADGQTPITGPLIGSSGTVAFGGVGQTQIPSGTTAQRSASPTDGMIRYNTDLQQYEGYKNGAWSIFGNGAGGTLFSDTVTATQGQTLITMPTGYVLGGDNLSVYVNGSRQIYNVNYTETSTTSFTFSSGLNVGDLVNYTIGASTSLSVNSASVLYNEGGTGAVDTNVQAKLQQIISVKDFGAVGDGVTNDTAAIQAAVAYAKTAKCALTVPSGTYILSGATTIEIDVGLMSMVGEGVVTFNCSAMTATYAFQIYSSLSYPASHYTNTLNKLSGINFIGGGVVGRGGLLCGHPTYTNTGQTYIENCSWYNFGINLYFASNAWRYMFYHCVSQTAVTYNMYSCSILNTAVNITGSSNFFRMFGGNMENAANPTGYTYVTISGATNSFTFDSTTIVINTSTFTAPLFVVAANSTLNLVSCTLPETPSYNPTATIGWYSYASGAGRVISTGGSYFPLGGSVRPTLSASFNDLYNGNWETGNTNGWTATSYGTGTASTAVASATAKLNGTYGLLVTTYATSGINVSQAIPCVAGQLVRANTNYKVATGGTNPVGYFQISFKAADGTVISTIGDSLPSSATAWTIASQACFAYAPAGTVSVTCNINGAPGSNVIYFDDAVLNIC